MSTIKIKFQGVGPLTRSTVGSEPINPELQALNDVLHWIWSWRVQVGRLVTSTDAQGVGESALEKRRSYSLASFDEHLLIVTGWNLARALRSAGKRFPSIATADTTHEPLRRLRNLYEHWDQQRKSFQDPTETKILSGAQFSKLFPTGKPWSITYEREDWLLGAIVPIRALTQELASVEEEVLRLESECKSPEPHQPYEGFP